MELPHPSVQMPRRFNSVTSVAAIVFFFLVLFVFEFLGHSLFPEIQLLPPVGSSFSSLGAPRPYSRGKTYSHADHSPLLQPANQCTEEQRNIIFQQLGLEGNMVRVVGCENMDWLDLFYEEEADIGTESFVGISVGCNKGDDAVHTARIGMSDPMFDHPAWKVAIGGLDGVCPEHINQKEINFPNRGGEMHCIEAMPTNFQLLDNARKLLGFDSEKFVVVNAALSARSGSAKFPDGALGKEDLQLTQCAQSSEIQEGCAEVAMYSLSDYVDKFVQSKGPINSLNIDTEGLDFEVLFGAGPVLDRTNYLEFEYHETGQWRNYHLLDTVRLLDGKGFTCYWASDNYLWRITECYFDVYNLWHGWSNVACVHRSYTILATRMEGRFLSTLANWQAGKSHP